MSHPERRRHCRRSRGICSSANNRSLHSRLWRSVGMTSLLGRCGWVTGAILVATPLHAQSIELGRWPATLHFEDRDSALATFEVSQERNRLLIDATTATGNNWGMGNVRADSTRLRFTWALDGPQPMQCQLSRRSALYWEGYCEDRVRGNDGKFARILVTLRREARSEKP
jgi:hypothetical protein